MARTKQTFRYFRRRRSALLPPLPSLQQTPTAVMGNQVAVTATEDFTGGDNEEGQDLQKDPQEATGTPDEGFDESLEEATNTLEGATEATDHKEGQDLQKDLQEATRTPDEGFEESLEEATITLEGGTQATDEEGQ